MWEILNKNGGKTKTSSVLWEEVRATAQAITLANEEKAYNVQRLKM